MGGIPLLEFNRLDLNALREQAPDKVKEDIKIDSFVGQKVATILFQASENEYTSKSNSETNVTTVDATLVKYNIKNDLALAFLVNYSGRGNDKLACLNTPVCLTVLSVYLPV